MKKYLLILFVLFSSVVSAQDLIVNAKGDSINCKISEMKDGKLYFSIIKNDEDVYTFLPLSEVKVQVNGFYSKRTESKPLLLIKTDYPTYRFSIRGGYSYMTAKIDPSVPSSLEAYTKELKSGTHLGADFTYYFSELWGLGMKYQRFMTKNEMASYTVYDEGYAYTDRMSDNLVINYIGPSVDFRFLGENKKNSFYFVYGLGYLGYENNGHFLIDMKMTGSTLGALMGLGFDLGLNKNIAINFEASYIIGAISEYKISNGVDSYTMDLDEPESVSHLNLSIGLAFNFNE